MRKLHWESDTGCRPSDVAEDGRSWADDRVEWVRLLFVAFAVAIMLFGGVSGCTAPESFAECAEAELGEGKLCTEENPPQKEEPQPYGTTKDYLTVKQDGEHRPIFLKGVNLGVGVPGTLAGHMAATREQYARWFDQMSEIGVNTLRIYTLHFPRFYEELAKHNEEHPDRPIYLLHGAWLNEKHPPGSETEDLHNLTESFDRAIRENVDCVYGNCVVTHRYGQAYGTYTADVSEWVMGWIIGREVIPKEVEATDNHHSEYSWEGDYFRVEDGSPTDVWFAKRVEYLYDYEKSKYGVERPISVSSWPTLDPIEHPSEDDEYSSEDVTSYDMANIEPYNAPAGVFATFHAYPYYPNFIIEDPEYLKFEDEQGQNSYMGYLFDMKEHFSDMPLVIGEFGVSSSWGVAHYGQDDMNHGGHTEVEQGEVADRILQTLYKTNTAGGQIFAWLDEWWKPTWISNPRDTNLDRRRYWHNVTAAEQNFGLIAYDLGPPEWSRNEPVDGSGPVSQMEATSDAEFFHVRLQLDRSLSEDDTLVVGLDTYADDLGESQLPNGVETNNRNEFAVVINGPDEAELRVTRAYNSAGIWYFGKYFDDPEKEGHYWDPNPDDDEVEKRPAQHFQSKKTDGEPWDIVEWMWMQPHPLPVYEGTDKNSWIERKFTAENIGKLNVTAGDDWSTSHDAVRVSDNEVQIRVPWSLIHYNDPSQRKVLHDDRRTEDVYETRTSEGVAVGVALNDQLLLESDRFTWSTWDDAPETEERVKPTMDIYGDAIDKLPYWLEEGDRPLNPEKYKTGEGGQEYGQE